jgi:hypothetical protein
VLYFLVEVPINCILHDDAKVNLAFVKVNEGLVISDDVGVVLETCEHSNFIE